MRFSRDRRGQSVVVGTVILFGFLILALSLYQVQIVPQENAEVEFQHFEEVRNDLVEVRAGILRAGTTDRTQYETVRLGTDYSPRLFAINPPAPSGTLRTSDAYNITIENESESRVNVTTRFLRYRPGYNEIDPSPILYDASVLYLNAQEEGGRIAVIEDQNLVKDNGEVRITALQNEFRRSGTEQTTLEFFPAENVSGRIPEGNLTVTVPTRLSGGEYWDDADIPDDVYVGVSGADENGVRGLTLNTTNDDLTVDTVGVQGEPEAPTQEGDVRGGEGNGESGGGMADSVSPVDGTVDQSNIPQGGRRLEFDITAEQPVDIVDFAVITQNDMSDRTFSDTGTTYGGNEPPTSVEGQITVNLREFSGSGSLPVGEFTDPNGPDVDIVVTLNFGDGSTTQIGIT
ncbi:hypothetical protein [Halorubrum trapanicum]|uniref:hypothetical protein n=1 Tax=Halorubrum trapanicum TaxID=29284 RepID=UPI003C704430